MTELYDPSGRPTAGRVGLFWLPAVVDITAITLAEFDAGIDISNAVYDGFGDGATQNVVARRKRGYAAEVKSLGRTVYDPTELVWDVDYQDQSTRGDEYAYTDTLIAGAQGVLCHRLDIEVGAEPEVGQIVHPRRATIGEVLLVDPGEEEGAMFKEKAKLVYGAIGKATALVA